MSVLNLSSFILQTPRNLHKWQNSYWIKHFFEENKTKDLKNLSFKFFARSGTETQVEI